MYVSVSVYIRFMQLQYACNQIIIQNVFTALLCCEQEVVYVMPLPTLTLIVVY